MIIIRYKLGMINRDGRRTTFDTAKWARDCYESHAEAAIYVEGLGCIDSDADVSDYLPVAALDLITQARNVQTVNPDRPQREALTAEGIARTFPRLDADHYIAIDDCTNRKLYYFYHGELHELPEDVEEQRASLLSELAEQGQARHDAVKRDAAIMQKARLKAFKAYMETNEGAFALMDLLRRESNAKFDY